jgi:hypothetical protein
VGREQRHCVHGRWRLVGQQSNHRLAIHRRAVRAGYLHVNLHRIQRQQRIAVSRCVGLSAGTDGQSECQSQQCGQQWHQQFDLVGKQRHGLHGLGRMVRTERHERIAVDQRTYGQQHLYIVLHRHGWHRDSIRDRVCPAGRAYRQFQQQPQHSHEGQQRNSDLVGDQRDVLHRERRLGRNQGSFRLTIHRRADGRHHLFAELHRIGRQRISGRHRLGHGTGTDSHLVGQSNHGKEWCYFRAYLVFYGFNDVYRFGRLDRHGTRQRHGNYADAHRDNEVHPDLHRNRRHRFSIRNRERIYRGAHRYLERESHQRFFR